MQSVYHRGADPEPPTLGRVLSEEHRRMLYDESGISPEVAAERGVRSILEGRELPPVYSWRQKKRAPGLLFTLHRPNGETSHVFRPDEPDPERPGVKYLQAPKKGGGDGNVLDVHPSLRHLLEDRSTPVVFVEGIKKADAITSAGRTSEANLLVAGISGTWNWLSEGEPIPDMYDVPVEGRRAYVCFDSDMLRKPGVQMAAERLAEHLEGRGAEVLLVYLSDRPDGSKTGADDFLASEAGGTLEELLDLARPFDPEELQREKLSRSERLRRSLAYLARRGGELPTKTRRDCSKLAAWRACVTVATRRGKPVGDGVEVRVPAMTGAEIAGMSQPTFSKCVRDLADDGLIRRINPSRREDAVSYVLLVPGGVFLSKEGGPRGPEGAEKEGPGGGVPHGDKEIPPLAPLPELRWSKPGRKAKRGVVEGTRRVRQGRALSDDSPSVRRPGKKRLEIVRYLLENGGAATREELLERFGGARTAWRDFKRQTLADLLGRRRQYRGEELSVGPPVIELDDDGIHLVTDWREALEKHRELGGEEEAANQQKVDHLIQRANYRKRHETEPDRHPANAHADGWAEELEPDPPEKSGEATAEDAPPLSPLAAAVGAYLERNPRDACQSPGWIAGTLWAFELYPGKTTPAEITAALDELGGEGYRRRVLAREPASPASLEEDLG